VSPQDQIDECVRLAEQLGVQVRREVLGGAGGGLCRIRGRPVLILDATADLAAQLDQCLTGLANLPEIDSVYVRPDLRARLERARGG